MSQQTREQKDLEIDLSLFRAYRREPWPLPPHFYAGALERTPVLTPTDRVSLRVRAAKMQRVERLDALLDKAPEVRAYGEQSFVRQYIDTEDMAEEDASSQNWRRMGLESPLEATQFFCFCLASLSTISWYPLTAESRPVFASIGSNFADYEEADMNHLWRARQQADSLGMTYDSYIRAVVRGHLDTDRAYHRLKPEDLHGPRALGFAESYQNGSASQ